MKSQNSILKATLFILLLRVTWNVVAVGIFFVLPFWWAFSVHVCQFILLPTLPMIFYAPFRRKLASTPYVPIVTGFLEALVWMICFTVAKNFISFPLLFVPSLLTLHVINHINRIWRDPGKGTDIYEANQLFAFAAVFAALFVLLNS